MQKKTTQIKKTTHVIVRSHHPMVRMALWGLLVMGAILSGWLLFEYGRSRGGFDSLRASRERDVLMERIANLDKEAENLRSQNAILLHAADIDRQAYEEVDRTVANLQSEILELKEEVTFYRGIVNPKDSTRGLHIQSFRLQQLEFSQTYHLRLILTQFEKNNQPISGTAYVSISGVRDGANVELDMDELVSASKGGFRFRFKYFQELEGDLVVPEDFTPIKVTLKVVPQGRNSQTVERTYSWSEMFTS